MELTPKDVNEESDTQWPGYDTVVFVESTTDRGFQMLTASKYASDPPENTRLLQQSSVIRYNDGLDRPGSSCLWVGEDHHLNRRQVQELRDYLTHWLETGKLFGEHDR